MPADFYASVTLLDDNQKKTTLRFVIGTITDVDFGAECTIARTRFDALLVDLKAITTANVSKAKLIVEDPGDWEDSGVPSTGSDVSEELALACHTNDSLQVDELAIIRVPSPEASVWINDDYHDGFDITDALAAAYVDNFSTAFEFSDGEHVNTAEGTSGIQSGYWRSRKMVVR